MVNQGRFSDNRLRVPKNSGAKAKDRKSGIFIHISSIPSLFGIGDLGPSAYQFADLLIKNDQFFWQILPLNPTELQYGNSPYHSCSSFAGNPLLISPELLYQDGLLKKNDLQNDFLPQHPKIEFLKVYSLKKKMFIKAYRLFDQRENLKEEFDDFNQKNAYWLDDYVLFEVLRAQYPEQEWNQWPIEIRNRELSALQSVQKNMKKEIRMHQMIQFFFFRQWNQFKSYCISRNLKIIGDMPIYVTFHSADTWAHPKLFKLDQKQKPLFKAGVPPDYFSHTGQLWGNPVYRWSEHRKNQFQWWMQRIRHHLEFVSLLRIDHFRGLVAYWEIPAEEKTAMNGHWTRAGGIRFFKTMVLQFPDLPFIAEDLGVITEDVVHIIDQLGIPGMRVLLFGFGESFPKSSHLPHQYPSNCLVYTGTHDNNTIQGWLKREMTAAQKRNLEKYLGRPIKSETAHWDLIRMAQASVAHLAIIPAQDILGLGEEARMNHPAHNHSNWQWRLTPPQLVTMEKTSLPQLKELTQTFARV